MHIFKKIQKSANPGEYLSFPFQRNISQGSAVTACEFWNVCEFLEPVNRQDLFKQTLNFLHSLFMPWSAWKTCPYEDIKAE